MPYQTSDKEYRQKFAQAISNTQASIDQLDRYYVTVDDEDIRGIDLCQRLIDTVELTIGDAVTLVTGPSGSGKSSELLRFGREMTERGRSVVYIDITQALRTGELLEPGRFLAAVVVMLIQEAGKVNDAVEHTKVDPRSFLKRVKDALENLTSLDLQVLGTGMSVNWTDTLRDSEEFRIQVSNAMLNNRARFRDEMHRIVREVANILYYPNKLSPIVVVDSIDHIRGDDDPESLNSYAKVRRSVEQIFFNFGDELSLPGFQVIYCVHSYVHCPAAAKTNAMLNIKVSDEPPNNTRFDKGIEQLRAIAEKRAPSDGGLTRLLGDDPDRLEEVLYLSGGLFRDLFHILYGIILNADTLPASERAISQAVADCRRDLIGGPNGLYREQLELLAEISANSKQVPRAIQQADFEELQTLGAILQYPDGPEGYWLGVHPLLEAVIQSVARG